MVCPPKHKRKTFIKAIEETLKTKCIAIGDRYEIDFVEIGIDEDHVYFLVQSVPFLSPTRIVQLIERFNNERNLSLISRGILFGMADEPRSILHRPASQQRSYHRFHL